MQALRGYVCQEGQALCWVPNSLQSVCMEPVPAGAVGLFRGGNPGLGKFLDRLVVSNSMRAGAVGLYLALTGKRLSKPADLLSIGLATHHVKADRLKQLEEALGLRTLKRSSTKAAALSGLEPMLQQFNVSPFS